MGFATALSGLAAAQADLQVIGNNIANANTTGFKESRIEFADILISSSSTAAGPGVKVSEVAQQFSQGNIESTQNNLDLAISGNGFFAMGESVDSTNATAFTRNGAFHLTPEGYLTNDAGFFLMGGAPKGATVNEGFSTGSPVALKVDTAQGKPAATKKVDLKVNLDSRLDKPAIAFTGYDPKIATGPDIASYNNSTTTTIFDSLGNTHTLTTYFVNETPDGAASSSWGAYAYLDGLGINTGSTATLDAPDAGVSSAIEGLTTADPATVTGLALTSNADATVVAATTTSTQAAATDTAIAAITNPAVASQVATAVAAATAAKTAADAAAALAVTAAAAAATALAADPTNTDLVAANAAATTASATAATAATDAGIAVTDASAIVDGATLTTATTSAATATSSATTAATNATAAATAANTVGVNAAVAAIALVTGVTTQQTTASTTAAATSGATVASVVTAAASAELVGTKIAMTFDSLGNLTEDTSGTNTAVGSSGNFVFSNIDISPLLALNVSADKLSFSLNPAGSTQFAADFGVNDVQQDGFASGNLTGVSFDKTGVLLARYSNGTSSPLGQVILGRFTNNQGLSKLGDTTWQESISSGTVLLDVAGGNNFGDIAASSLENSNTDIATQLVKMIVAQQAYQANAQTISTEDEIIQRILQL